MLGGSNTKWQLKEVFLSCRMQLGRKVWQEAPLVTCLLIIHLLSMWVSGQARFFCCWWLHSHSVDAHVQKKPCICFNKRTHKKKGKERKRKKRNWSVYPLSVLGIKLKRSAKKYRSGSTVLSLSSYYIVIVIFNFQGKVLRSFAYTRCDTQHSKQSSILNRQCLKRDK